MPVILLQVEHIPKCLTTFSKVKQLELYFCAPTIFRVQKIFAILQACPLLQKFHLVVCHDQDPTSLFPILPNSDGYVYFFKKNIG